MVFIVYAGNILYCLPMSKKKSESDKEASKSSKVSQNRPEGSSSDYKFGKLRRVDKKNSPSLLHASTILAY